MKNINVSKLADMIAEKQGGDMAYAERGMNGMVEEDEDSVLEFVNKQEWDEYADEFEEEKQELEEDYNGEWMYGEEW